MFDLAKPKIKEIEKNEDGSYGKYVIEPLERGYGTTLGNTLRRTMLSSLPGSAISQVKIEGILHEFMPLKGMKEDISEFIANLKKVNIKNTNKGNEKKYAYLNVKGKRTVTAGDIQIGGSLSVINPDFVIAHLGTDDAVLNAEFIITDGYGYQPAQIDSEYVEYIAIDSIYSPVLNVVPKVENARVGHDTDYDKLTLEIFTDGTIFPDEVISMAGKIVINQMEIFANYAGDNAANPFIFDKDEENDKNEEIPIEDLELSLRSYNALKNAGFETTADLIKLTGKDLLKVKFIGEQSLEEISSKLEAVGMKLKEIEN